MKEHFLENYLSVVDNYYTDTYKNELKLNKNYIVYFEIKSMFETKIYVAKENRLRYYILKDGVYIYFSDFDICTKLFTQLPLYLRKEYLHFFTSIYFDMNAKEYEKVQFDIIDINKEVKVYSGNLTNYRFAQGYNFSFKTEQDCIIDLNDFNLLLNLILNKDITADNFNNSSKMNLKTTLMKYIISLKRTFNDQTIINKIKEIGKTDRKLYNGNTIKTKLTEFEEML